MLAKCPNCGWKPPLFKKEPENGASLECPSCSIKLRYSSKTRVWIPFAGIIAMIISGTGLRGAELGSTVKFGIYITIFLFFVLAFASQKYEIIDSDEVSS